VDKFIQIIEENGFQPEDIDTIVAQPTPAFQFKAWKENALKSAEDYCFNARYLLACAAYRIPPFRWQDPEIRQDAKLWEFMKRVNFGIVVDEKDFGLAQLEDPRTFQMRIEVVAGGKTFKEKRPYPKGLPEPVEFRNTDQELIEKFIDNASQIIPSNKATESAKTILELEGLSNVAYLNEMVCP